MVAQFPKSSFGAMLKLAKHSLYGDSERLLGKWFQRTGKRNEIFLATKYGYVGNPMDHNINSSAEYTREACAKCLKTLGIDCIDLCKLRLTAKYIFSPFLLRAKIPLFSNICISADNSLPKHNLTKSFPVSSLCSPRQSRDTHRRNYESTS